MTLRNGRMRVSNLRQSFFSASWSSTRAVSATIVWSPLLVLSTSATSTLFLGRGSASIFCSDIRLALMIDCKRIKRTSLCELQSLYGNVLQFDASSRGILRCYANEMPMIMRCWELRMSGHFKLDQINVTGPADCAHQGLARTSGWALHVVLRSTRTGHLIDK